MKLIKFITLIIYFTFQVSAQTPPPSPTNDECIVVEGESQHYFALVHSIVTGVIGSLCADEDSVVQDDLGIYGAKTVFDNPVDGVKFISQIKIDPYNSGLLLTSRNEIGYFSFLEISESNTINPLPSIESKILGASIVYNPSKKENKYSLVVNYKNNDIQDSTTIVLDNNHLDIEVSISWINQGCVNLMNECIDYSNGQIEVKVSYGDTEIVNLIDNLSFVAPDPNDPDIEILTKSSLVYWGELDSDKFNANISLNLPNYLLSNPNF